MIRLIARLLGFCGHEWKWGEPRVATVDGEPLSVQPGECARCGALRIRTVYVE